MRLLLKQRPERHYGQLALLGKLQTRWQVLLRAKELRRWGITAKRERVLAIARAGHGTGRMAPKHCLLREQVLRYRPISGF